MCEVKEAEEELAMIDEYKTPLERLHCIRIGNNIYLFIYLIIFIYL